MELENISEVESNESESNIDPFTMMYGLSQNNQWRLGKSEGKPGTPLSATNSDRQNQ